MKKQLLTLGIILITITSYSQQWLKNGDDFVCDTSTYTSNIITFSQNDSGNIIAVSQRLVDTANLSAHETYQVEVFNRINGQLIQKGQTLIADSIDESFGESLRLSGDGNTLVIGSPDYETNGLTLAGKVQVFSFDGNTWQPKGSIFESGSIADYLGTSVDLSHDGNTVIIGADEDNIFNKGGYAIVYSWNGSSWNQQGDSISSDEVYDLLGHKTEISADGNIIAIGIPGYEDSVLNVLRVGQVKLFSWNGTNWTQMGNSIDGDEYLTDMGDNISLSDDGQIIAIGVPDYYGDTGKVDIYSYDSLLDTWNLKGNSLTTQDFGSNFGANVSLSEDGNNVAFTWSTTKMLVYSWDTTSSLWIMKGSETNEDYTFGQGLDINYNGTLVSNGSNILIDSATGNLGQDGQIRFYKFDSTSSSTSFIYEENDIKESFNIYPNPNNGSFTVDFLNQENTTYSISNNMGQIIDNGLTNNKIKSFDLSNFSKGTYYISITSDKNHLTKAFIIN